MIISPYSSMYLTTVHNNLELVRQYFPPPLTQSSYSASELCTTRVAEVRWKSYQSGLFELLTTRNHLVLHFLVSIVVSESPMVLQSKFRKLHTLSNFQLNLRWVNYFVCSYRWYELIWIRTLAVLDLCFYQHDTILNTCRLITRYLLEGMYY